MSNFTWKIKKKLKYNKARIGTISTPHGDIQTPAFIFCATKGALKSFTTKDAKENIPATTIRIILILFKLPLLILLSSC